MFNGSHGTCPSPKLASGKWDTQATCLSLHRTHGTVLLSCSSSMSRSDWRVAISASGFLCPEQSQEEQLVISLRSSLFNVSRSHLQPKIITTIKTTLCEWFQMLSRLEVEDKSKQAETMVKGGLAQSEPNNQCSVLQVTESGVSASGRVLLTWLSTIYPAWTRLFLTHSLPSLEFLHSAKQPLRMALRRKAPSSLKTTHGKNGENHLRIKEKKAEGDRTSTGSTAITYEPKGCQFVGLRAR